jgi:midasin (ATPase involved in ribosome maturation)
LSATHDPNEGYILMKQKTLSKKFFSRFVSNDFFKIPKDELLNIEKYTSFESWV